METVLTLQTAPDRLPKGLQATPHGSPKQRMSVSGHSMLGGQSALFLIAMFNGGTELKPIINEDPET